MSTLAASAIAVLLGAGLAALPTTAAEAAPDQNISSAKPVERAYGDGQVYQDDRRQRVRVRFDDERGDRVRLGTTRRDVESVGATPSASRTV